MRKINLCKQRSRIFKVRGRWFVVWHQIGGTTTNYCLGTSFVGTRVWCWRNFPCDLGRRVEQTPTATVTELILQDIQQIFLRPKSLLPTRDHDHANSITSRRNFSECETISVSFNRKNERKISSWSIEHNICPSRKGADTNSQLFALRTRQLLRRVVLISTEAQVTQYKDGVVDLVVTKVRTSTHKPVLVYSRRPKKSYSLG